MCPWQDLNLQPLRDVVLNHTRMPVPPQGQNFISNIQFIFFRQKINPAFSGIDFNQNLTLFSITNLDNLIYYRPKISFIKGTTDLAKKATTVPITA